MDKIKWFVKEARLRIKYMVSKDCIFCKIVNGEMGTKFLARRGKTVAFADINPVASVHILIVPKKHIESAEAVGIADGADLADMFSVAAKIVREKGIDAYRLTFNGGRYQHVPHLHMHLLSGKKIEWEKL